MESHAPHSLSRNMHRREWWIQRASFPDVVEAHDGNVVRYGESPVHDCPIGADGRFIAHGEHGRWRFVQGQKVLHLAETLLLTMRDAGRDEIRVKLQAGLLHG